MTTEYLSQFSHGEVNFFKVKALPKNLKKVDVNGGYYIVGESETHGNDHRVVVKDQVEFYRDQFERLYLRADVETEVYCPKGDRHDAITILPGLYEIDKAKEVDPLTKKLRDVAD